MHKCVNKSIANVYHLEQMVDNFYPYSQENLGFDRDATVVFQSDKDNASTMLGKTAYYDPQNYEVVLYVDGRHPKDILRSLSHELVHHAQNCRGDFTGGHATPDGYAQKDPHLRKMEREAYTKGNLIFRDFEDLIKTGKKEVDIDFSRAGEPKMSLKEWKNNEINTKLMKKWRLLKETKEEVTEATDTEELEEGHVHGPECGCPGQDLQEDSEGEETYHYAEDEGSDRKREGRLEAHLDAIEHHLHKLRGDMAYDEDHERRGEKGTDFHENKEENVEEGFIKKAIGTTAGAVGGALGGAALGGGLGAAAGGALGGVAGHTLGSSGDDKGRREDSTDDDNAEELEEAGGYGKSPAAFTGTEKREKKEIEDVKSGKGLEESALRKISIREAKEITRRVIEKIKKENK